MKELSETSCWSASSDSAPTLRRSRFNISCSAMAKFTTIIFLASVLLVVILVIFSESVSGQQRNRTRSKYSAVKKKKSSSLVAPTTIPTPVETTTLPIPELSTESLAEDIDDSSAAPQEYDLLGTPAPIQETETVTSQDGEQSTEVKTPPKKLQSKIKVPRNAIVEKGKNPLPFGCDEDCDKELDCTAIDPVTCPTGLVLDRCNCCLVCGAGEGNRCNDATLNLPFNPDIGICGPGLVCKLRNDLDITDTLEALCECRETKIVCGSDNQTYSSECKLREAAHSNPNLTVASWKPCVSAPWISTPAENVTVVAGDEVALSCEVRAYPPPIVHWEFIADDNRSPSTILPGDDSSVVVVVRGGPEQMMTTTWIQIIGVNARRQGTYFCVAKNEEGQTQSSASVSVYSRQG